VGPPVAAVTNAPVAAVTNAPVEAVTGAPVEAVTNAPVEAVTNAPVEAVTGAPVTSTVVTSAPVTAVTSAPVAAVTGAPVVATASTAKSFQTTFKTACSYTTGEAKDYEGIVGEAWTTIFGTKATAKVAVRRARRSLASANYDVTVNHPTQAGADATVAKVQQSDVGTTLQTKLGDNLTFTSATTLATRSLDQFTLKLGEL